MTTAAEQYRRLVAKLEAINPSEPQVQPIPSLNTTPEPVVAKEVTPANPYSFKPYLPK